VSEKGLLPQRGCEIRRKLGSVTKKNGKFAAL
jgi:hypothetical protein